MSKTEFVSPVGRLVQGSMTLSQKIDMKTNAPVMDNGQPVMESFFAVAFDKNDPHFAEFYGKMVATAKADFPHLFDAAGNCTHPRFSWKLQDGDGRDQNGKSVADKPGFKGHWIVKFGSRYAPKCFKAGQYDPMQQLQNPDEIIKRGHFVRVAGTISGNGVSASDTTNVPGLFLSGNLVEHVAFGEEIVSGPNAADVFGKAGAPAALPAGASAVPLGPSAAGAPSLPGLPASTPGLPGLPALPGAAAALPGLPASTPALPGLPALPGVPAAAPALPGLPAAPAAAPAAPTFQMTAAAGAFTREQYLAGGWTDADLIAKGFMVQVG